MCLAYIAIKVLISVAAQPPKSGAATFNKALRLWIDVGKRLN